MVPAFAYYVIPTILVLFGIRKYREHKWGLCTNTVKLLGKVAIITGANSGIGYEIAKDLARRGALVVMACRNLDAAAKAICKLKNELNCSSVIVPMELDLGSVRSIRNFTDEVKSTYSDVHLLINNAGVAYPDKDKARKTTKDGFEIHFGTNHLGHFLLTNMLLDRLEKTKSSRIVVLSSLKHENGKLLLDDLNLEKVTNKTDAYANSKLANVYFCRELAKRTPVNVYAVCPGWVYTNLFRHYQPKWYQNILILPVAFMFMRSAKQGAQTAIYCATEPELQDQTGLIYRDCKSYESKVKFDEVVSKTLWEASQRMLDEINRKLTQKGLYDITNS